MTDSTFLIGPDRNSRWLLLEGTQVLEWGTGKTPDVGSDCCHLSCEQGVIGPGEVNAHTHVYSALAPLGMPDPVPPPENFPQILERVWWRLDRALKEDTLEASAQLYGAEALLAGTTSLVDHHESPNYIAGSLDQIAGPFSQLGIRAVLCFGATERNGGRSEGQQGLEECRRFIMENRAPLIRGVVALHASFTVSDETISEAGRLCKDLDTVMHVHLAEDRVDVEDALERGYPGPLERLFALNALPTGSLCAHGVHLNEEQVKRAGDTDIWIMQNPRSNRGNKVGYPGYLSKSSKVALGTDGYPSDLGIEEVALLEEAEQHGDNPVTVKTRRAAGRILMGERFGINLDIFSPGATADLVVREGDGVKHVVVGGQLVVRDGTLINGNIDTIRARAADQAAALWVAMKAL